MSPTTCAPAAGALLIDLHSIRAGLAAELAQLDQAEGLRRQRIGRAADLAPPAIGPAIGDIYRDTATGELGTLTEIKGDRGILQFAGRRFSAELIALNVIALDDAELPSDCEAAS